MPSWGRVLKSISKPKTSVQPDKDALIKRLNRIEGQVRGVTKDDSGRSLLC